MNIFIAKTHLKKLLQNELHFIVYHFIITVPPFFPFRSFILNLEFIKTHVSFHSFIIMFVLQITHF